MNSSQSVCGNVSTENTKIVDEISGAAVNVNGNGY